MNTLLQSARLAQFESKINEAQAFGEALRTHRREVGLTQEELAEVAGLSVRSISGWERGEGAAPRRDTLALLVRALRLSGAERAAFEAMVVRAHVRRSERPVKLTMISAADGDPEHHNLARSMNSFVGRQRDLAEFWSLVRKAPAVTLLGAGGIGKLASPRSWLGSRQVSLPTERGWSNWPSSRIPQCWRTRSPRRWDHVAA